MTEKIPKEIYEAFRLLKEREYEAAEGLLNQGLQMAGDPTNEALYHSTLGVLFRMKGDGKEAWRHYEKAEKLLPDDPSLKLISAKFLIEQFAQYETAIKKLKKVLKLAQGSPSFEHQAHALIAIAFLRKGEREKAAHSLKQAMEDFPSLPTAENINLEVVAAFVARNFSGTLCRDYLENGIMLAHSKKEKRRADLMKRLLQAIMVPEKEEKLVQPSA